MKKENDTVEKIERRKIRCGQCITCPTKKFGSLVNRIHFHPKNHKNVKNKKNRIKNQGKGGRFVGNVLRAQRFRNKGLE